MIILTFLSIYLSVSIEDYTNVSAFIDLIVRNVQIPQYPLVYLDKYTRMKYTNHTSCVYTCQTKIFLAILCNHMQYPISKGA